VGFAFVTSVASRHEKSALTAVQLLWVNLIQDTLAALALATDPPTLELLDRPPEPKGSSLITFNMWKMIFGQSVIQLAVIFTLNFAGPSKLFPDWENATLKTVVFNTFVWLQIFNEINCRRIDNRLNVFFRMHKNPLLITILVAMVFCQVLIIFVGGAAFSVTRLNGHQWLLSIALGFLAIPAGAIVRLVPNKFIRKFLPRVILERPTNNSDDGGEIEDWQDAMEAIHDDLVYFRKIRNERRFRSVRMNRTGPSRSLVGPPVTVARVPPVERPVSGTSTPTERSRRHARLYSVNSASTLIPGLVALSPALLPSSPFADSRRLQASEEF
jgi:P-type Ca2+ transporter type 2C